MLFRIKENEILLLIEQFLKSQKLLGSLRHLEKESHVVLGNLNEESYFLRDLVMDGEWADVLEYLNPLRENSAYKKVRLMIEKQRYLELLATEKGSYDASQVMKSLSILEDMCPTRHEYTALCYLLTRPHLKQHPSYSNWNQYESRLECFDSIHGLLLQANSTITDDSSALTSGRLVDLLTKGMFYESALQLCSQKLAPGGCVNVTDALTNNLLQCKINDKEAILLHWLYEIPASALIKPAKKKIVEVELEAGRPLKLIRDPSVVKSTEFRRTRGPRPRDTPVGVSIDRGTYPLSPLPCSLLPTSPDGDHSDSTIKLEEDPLEATLGDSEVAMNQESGVSEDTVNLIIQEEPDRKMCDELYVPSLLEIEMGFKDVQLVDTKDGGTQSNGQQEAPVEEEAEEALLGYSEKQEEKIKWLQKQLNELRIQQDSLRMSAALEKAGKIPTRPSLGEPRTHTKPLYEHPSNLNTPTPTAEVECGPEVERGVTSGAVTERGVTSGPVTERGVTSGAVTERGTSAKPDKPQTTASSNGWLDHNHSSLHTLESFSEDSLRPSKTSTPNKVVNPVKCHKVADSSMLRVKFSPTAVLEDVQPIRAAAFHPRGELIAIGSNSKALRVCSCHMLSDSVQTLVREDGCQDMPVLFKRNRHHRGSIYTVAWNPTGNVIASGSNDKSLIVVGFDADNCISTCTDREFSFHKGTVRDIHFHDETTMCSVGGGDNTLHVSDIQKGVEVSAYTGHTDTIQTVTSYNDTLVTGSGDGTIRLWDKRSTACTRVIGAAIGTQGKSGISSISLNNFGNLMCAARDDGLCMLYDIEMGKLLAAFSPHTPTTCRSVHFYRNPRYILSGSYDGTIALTCAEQVLLNPDINCSEILGTHRDKVTKVIWHPTKQAFGTCSADRTVCLWTAKEGVDD